MMAKDIFHNKNPQSLSDDEEEIDLDLTILQILTKSSFCSVITYESQEFHRQSLKNIDHKRPLPIKQFIINLIYVLVDHETKTESCY